MKVKLVLTSAALAILLTLLFPSAPLEETFFADNVWKWLSFFLTCLVVGAYIAQVRSVVSRRILFSLTLSFVIGHVNILIEALIFHVMEVDDFIRALAFGLFTSALISVALTFSLKTRERIVPNQTSWPLRNWGKPVLLGTILYLFLYIAAGMILQFAYAPVMDFYAGKIPPLGWILVTQIFRALIFTGACVMIIRTTSINQTKQAILVGAIFAILGGIAPLISPNELMPSHIRVAHGVEVGISNFVYGVLLTYLFRRWRNGGSNGHSV